MQPLGHDDPRRIGDYRLLGVLGVGGMGRVYLGRNAGGRTVAVKVIRPDLITDPEFRARFQREVAAARRVGSSCTAPVLDADVNADPPWLATGYVAGIALSDAVERFGPFGERSLIVLARGLAEALVAVHEAGVVHRDLKPSNVLLAVDGPKVIDFGIARAVEDTALTTTGKVIGSPAFMCPEQVTGETVGPAGDMFALGGVLTYAAGGQGPFGGGDTVQLLFRIVYEEPRIDAVPEALRGLVAACLSKNPADRPSPRQVLEHLDHLGARERSGWLPAAVLEEVSQRAVRLLDLDSGPGDLPGHPTEHVGTPPHSQPLRYVQDRRPTLGHDSTGTRSPSGSYATQANPADGYPLAQPATNRWNAGVPSGRTDPTALHTPAERWHGSAERSPSGYAAPGAGAPDSGRHGGQATPGYGPPGRDRSADSRPAERPGRRGPLIAALAVVAVAVAAGAFFIGLELRGDQPGGTEASPSAIVQDTTTTSETTTTSAAATTTESPASAVPAEFVGTWRGTAADGLITFDIQLTIDDGEIGAELARSTNTGKITGHRCSRIERLTDVTGDQLTFVARLGPDSPRDCADEGSVSTVRLQPDGSLAYSTPGLFGGEIAGTLRRG
ncbi:serine/threonine-protein kinase [Nocardia higoensis]|uniref:serine/threonine-protein kinase n=1 Tax=Nocardia higoensis TaxID=228599 RepID=UPI000593B72F|nr:serine/threonine-protein kinase [Nocardia higoensis]